MEAQIQEWVAKLHTSFGKPHPLVPTEELYGLYKERKFTAMVGIVQRAFRLQDISITVGYVKCGGPEKAPAWIETPRPMPMYGSSAFKQLKVTMFIRKEFLERLEFPTVLMAISHELAHVVLNSLYHELKSEERVVDLTAMHLGFRHAFITPNNIEVSSIQTVERFEWKTTILPQKVVETNYTFHEGSRLGYLSFKERLFAAKLMGTTTPITY